MAAIVPAYRFPNISITPPTLVLEGIIFHAPPADDDPNSDAIVVSQPHEIFLRAHAAGPS